LGAAFCTSTVQQLCVGGNMLAKCRIFAERKHADVATAKKKDQERRQKAMRRRAQTALQ
jgi:hypothetical protein